MPIQGQQEMGNNMAPTHLAKVEEVIQGSTYTYLLVSEKGQTNWLAASKVEVAVGDEGYYEKPLRMENFTSKELDRTFEVIYFINQFSKSPQMVKGKTPAKGHMGKAPSKKDASVKLEKAEGELTIADIFKDKGTYSGQKIKITGVVVKVNKSIMGRNWLHLQDGTKHNNDFDLTVTSPGLANVGETITVEGTITLNKDFGAGYSYNVIMENASIIGTVKGV